MLSLAVFGHRIQHHATQFTAPTNRIKHTNINSILVICHSQPSLYRLLLNYLDWTVPYHHLERWIL